MSLQRQAGGRFGFSDVSWTGHIPRVRALALNHFGLTEYVSRATMHMWRAPRTIRSHTDWRKPFNDRYNQRHMARPAPTNHVAETFFGAKQHFGQVSIMSSRNRAKTKSVCKLNTIRNGTIETFDRAIRVWARNPLT
jgi:hypothetical protein